MALIQGANRNRDVLKFWNLHRHSIYKFCDSKIPEGVPIQDVMQNIYIRLHTHFEEVRNYNCPFAWLVRVAKNICNDEIRRLNRYQTKAKNYVRHEVRRIAVKENEWRAAVSVDLLMLHLPPRWKNLMDLHFLKGVPLENLTNWYGQKRGTVERGILRSLKRIRQNALDSVKKS